MNAAARSIDDIKADMAKLEDEMEAAIKAEKEMAIRECRRLIREYRLTRSSLESAYVRKRKSYRTEEA